jgi:hypothetical protein
MTSITTTSSIIPPALPASVARSGHTTTSDCRRPRRLQRRDSLWHLAAGYRLMARNSRRKGHVQEARMAWECSQALRIL